ncbi:hypothetical protein ACVWYG_003877 [Pedobacter sp. UYEF25]
MKILLKERKLKDNKISLYLEYYKGSTTDKDGKRAHMRDTEFLQLYLVANPKTALDKKQNKETLALAENILAIKKTDFVQGKFKI